MQQQQPPAFQEIAIQLNKRLQDLNVANCSGCYEGLENQQGHPCLYRSNKDVVEHYFEESFESLSTVKIVDAARKYLLTKFLRSAEKHDNEAVTVKPDSTT